MFLFSLSLIQICPKNDLFLSVWLKCVRFMSVVIQRDEDEWEFFVFCIFICTFIQDMNLSKVSFILLCLILLYFGDRILKSNYIINFS